MSSEAYDKAVKQIVNRAPDANAASDEGCRLCNDEEEVPANLAEQGGRRVITCAGCGRHLLDDRRDQTPRGKAIRALMQSWLYDDTGAGYRRLQGHPALIARAYDAGFLAGQRALVDELGPVLEKARKEARGA